MNSLGMDGPLIASLNNGLVFRFLPGKPLTDTQMRDKHLLRLVAEELARLHATLPLDTDPRADPLFVPRTTFENVPKTFKDPIKQAKYSENIPYEDLAREFTALQQHLLDQNLDLAICHGDLWQGNILYDPLEGDRVHFVDFEQSGYQFAAFDVGFYLVTLAGGPPDFENHYPTDETRKYFIQHYLREKLRLTGSELITDEEGFNKKLEEFNKQVLQCELLALLLVILQCLLFDDRATVDNKLMGFNFYRMAMDAWKEYMKRKGQYLSDKVKDTGLAMIVQTYKVE